MDEGLRLYAQLKSGGYLHPTLATKPLPDWRCTASQPIETGFLKRVKVPNLFRAYLRQGSLILAEPAIDREFGTIDYLTYFLVDEAAKRKLGIPRV